MSSTSVGDVLDALQDVDFSAGRRGTVQAAENAGAPEEGVKALRALPPDEYGNRDEVARSVSDRPGPAGHRRTGMIPSPRKPPMPKTTRRPTSAGNRAVFSRASAPKLRRRPPPRSCR
ncbi:DUF2795 domain-containing protein [Streptomyces sp. NPDC052079]|uniref:DUF2795 domain-containing protein n=1 Tax=Streptomyces sp. NPDC052079 TaxID=3155526 RepID=UPI0034217310